MRLTPQILPAVDEREQAVGDNPSLAPEVVQPTPTRDVTPAVRLDHRHLVGLVAARNFTSSH
jgi:hypothetical protein